MADYRDILAGLQVGDMDKRDALTQGLLMAAAGALQGGDRGSMLARTIYGGMQGYQDSISAKEKQLMQQLALRKQATELAEYERKKDDERALAEAMQKAQGAPRATFAPGSVQSPAFAPDVNAGLPAAPVPNARDQRRQMLQATIDNLIQRGAGHMAAPLQAELAKMEEEYSPEVRYDQQGNAFLVSKQGGVKPLAGIKARDKIIGENLGDVERYRTEYSLDSKGIVARGQSPDSKASNATTVRGQDMVDARARDANAIAGDVRAQTNAIKAREDADALRKEFNSLAQVKNFADVAPLFNAAANAPDNPAGDFALIYGVGKILDPGSVVREGEMGMVVRSGSPAQRVMGHLRYLQGNGRLTPQHRAELVQMLHNAVSERQGAYQTARTTYEGLARERGYKPEEVFVGAPTVTQPPAKKGGWTVEQVGN